VPTHFFTTLEQSLMAVLGFHVRLLLPLDTATTLEALGFEPVPELGEAVYTDGQIVVECTADVQSLTVQYHSARGVAPPTVIDGFPLTVVASTPFSHEIPDGSANPWLGFFDGLVVYSTDVQASQEYFEGIGFFVLEQHQEPFERIDLTDGLLRVSIQHRTGTPTLLYATDLTREAAEELAQQAEEYARVHGTDQEVYFVNIQLPHVAVVVIHDFDL
jgi:hypothetical protein